MVTWLQVVAVFLPLFAAAAAGIMILRGDSAHASINRFWLDTSDPVIDSMTVSPPANAHGWHNGDVTVEVCASDPDAMDNADVSGLSYAHELTGPRSNSFGPNGPLSDCTDLVWYDHDTDYTAEIHVHDNSDNISQSEYQKIRIDRTEPWAKILSGPTVSSTIPDPTPTFEFDASDIEVCVYSGTNTNATCVTGAGPIFGVQLVSSGLGAERCAVDPSPPTDVDQYDDCVSPYTTPTLMAGEHTFCVLAKDLASNTSEPDCVTFTVEGQGDVTPPVLKITYALYGTFYGGDTTPAAPPTGSNYTPNTWTKKDVAVFISCSDEEGGSGIATNSYPERINFTTQGKHTFNPPGTCVDNAGNVAVEPVGLFIQIDTQAPTCTAPTTPWLVAAAGSTPLVIDFTAGDNLSGVTKTVTSIVKTSAGGGSFTGAVPRPAGSTWTFIGAVGARWDANFLATDGAGNTRTCKRGIKAQ